MVAWNISGWISPATRYINDRLNLDEWKGASNDQVERRLSFHEETHEDIAEAVDVLRFEQR